MISLFMISTFLTTIVDDDLHCCLRNYAIFLRFAFSSGWIGADCWMMLDGAECACNNDNAENAHQKKKESRI